MKVVLLFEHTGLAAMAFKALGWHVTIIDTLNKEPNPFANVTLNWDILKREADIIELCRDADLIFGMPPCTDLAVSGTRHFVNKAKINTAFQDDAIYLARSVERIGTAVKKPWGIENPIGVMSSKWRKPNAIIQPWHFGGYLPEDDIHPLWPQYIVKQDRYPKSTCIWCGEGFEIPRKKPVDCAPGYSKQHLYLGGKSAKTKLIRSASPRGFFIALAEHYTRKLS